MPAPKVHFINYLKQKAESERDKALGSLGLLLDKSVGIGDHSTEDFYKNLDEALDALVDEEDMLEVLSKYF